MVDVSRTGGELRRQVVTFRDRGGGRFRRGEEFHRLHLHRPEVLGALRAAGFAACTLPGGYAGEEPLPRGLVAYLARKR